MSIKQFFILFKAHYTKVKKNKEHACIIKIDKKRLKIVLAVLDAVRNRFPETQEFIDGALETECEKERMAADEVIFLF